MKRTPPSIRMKEEVQQLLRGEAVEGAAADTPMRGLCGRWHATFCRCPSRRKPRRFWGGEHYRLGGRLRVRWRNGYEPKGVQSEAGLLELAVPQLRATEERFCPKLVERLGTRSVDLEELVQGVNVRAFDPGCRGSVWRELWAKPLEQEYGEPD